LFCEYVIALEHLKATIEVYAENIISSNGQTGLSAKYKTIKDMLTICADLEREVLIMGFSLEIH
tara:strand:+ start:1350 stop:1541 length:192 start_codon:yes stop_codon:yes gene_type:complete